MKPGKGTGRSRFYLFSPPYRFGEHNKTWIISKFVSSPPKFVSTMGIISELPIV
jgi:hypothetical protein